MSKNIVTGWQLATGQPLAPGKRLLHDYFSSIGATEHSPEQIELVLGAISYLTKYGLYGTDVMTHAVRERFKIVPAVFVQTPGRKHALNTSVGEGILFALLMKEWTKRDIKSLTSSVLTFHNEKDSADSDSAIKTVGDYKGKGVDAPYRIYHEGRILSVIALHYVVCRAAAYGATLRIRQSAAVINDTLLSGNLGLRAWLQTIVDDQRDTEFGRTSVMYFRIRVFVTSDPASIKETVAAYDTLFGPDYVYFLGIRKTTRDVSSPFQ
jgi:hypothetical protein